MSLLKEFPLCLLSPQEPKMREKVLKYIYFTTFKDKPRPSASFGWWGRDNCFFWKRNDVKHEKLDKDIQLLKKKKKSIERVILGQPGKIGHMQWCIPLSPDTSSPTEVATALASHCCSSHIGFNHLIPIYAAKHRTFPALSSLSVPFSWHLPPQWHSNPGLSSRGAAAPPDPRRVPAPGSVPPLGRYGTLEPTTSSAETMPGVVYWLGSSILSLHNYGFSMQERGKKKIAALVCYGLKLQLFA